MKTVNKISDFLFSLLRVLVVIAVLGALLFIVQGRMKHLYGTAIDPSLAKGSIFHIFAGKLPFSSATEEPEEKPEEEPQVPTVEFVIPKGAKVEDIGKLLVEKGLITHVPTFVKLTKEKNAYPYFKPGTFYIPEGTKAVDIIDLLTKEEKEKASGIFEVTLPGSVTSAQVADILLAQGLIQDKATFVQAVKKAGKEGKFKPGTHIVHGPIKTADLIEVLCTPVK